MKRIPRLIALILAMAGMGSLYSDVAHTQSYQFNPIYDEITLLDWGGEHHRVEGNSQYGWVRLHYVKFSADLLSADVVIANNTIGSSKSVEDMARDSGALVGINANFYDPNSNIPIGFLLDDDEILSAPFASRATLAVEFFGRYHFLNPEIELLLKTSSGNYAINGINRSVYNHALILYTPQFGPPLVLNSELHVIGVRDNRVIWNGPAPIPSYLINSPETSWLVASESAKKILEPIQIAEHIEIDYEMEPERFLIRDAIQAGPLLITNGEPDQLEDEGFSSNFLEQRSARSAIGITHENDLILVVVTSGNGSVGMSLYELAEYLLDLGAVDAMAVDGGGSSSLVFKQGATWRNVGGTREVPVGLVFSKR